MFRCTWRTGRPLIKFKVAVIYTDAEAEVDEAVQQRIRALVRFLRKNKVQVSEKARPEIDTREAHRNYIQSRLMAQACQIRDYIRENHGKPLSHDSIAECFQISVHYLYKLLHEQLNITPASYLNTVRAKEAAKLLVESDLLVRDIGLRCGYYTDRSFYRNFKKQYGCSPTRFRNQGVIPKTGKT